MVAKIIPYSYRTITTVIATELIKLQPLQVRVAHRYVGISPVDS